MLLMFLSVSVSVSSSSSSSAAFILFFSFLFSLSLFVFLFFSLSFLSWTSCAAGQDLDTTAVCVWSWRLNRHTPHTTTKQHNQPKEMGPKGRSLSV